jgi:hypothetical protein
VLAHAGSANRAPITSAGPDRTIVPGTGSVVLDGAAADVDFDWLDFEWRDASGSVIGPRGDTYPGVPHFCGPETWRSNRRPRGTAELAARFEDHPLQAVAHMDAPQLDRCMRVRHLPLTPEVLPS